MTDSAQTSAPAIDRVVIIHGATATPDRHFYPSLVESLEATGVQVSIPGLPDTMNPDPTAWGEAIATAVGGVDESTLIITHSLGTPALLQYLSGLDAGWHLGGLIEVAGFAKAPAEPLQGFVDGIDLDLIRDSTSVRHAFISTNDERIPASFTVPLAEALDATVHEIADAGHFLDDDGVTSVPELEQVAAAVVRG